MDRPERSENGAPRGRQAGVELTAAALFTLLWDALADLLGTAATATLVRRATRRAALHDPELAGVAIVRESVEYRYSLPSTWQDRTAVAQRALHHLVEELLPLLVELTGPVAVRHLAQIPELRERGIIPPPEEMP